MRLAEVFRGGGGGKFDDPGWSASGFLRRIHDGTSGFTGMRLRLGSATGLSMTIVPSDVREHAPRGSIRLPANITMPNLRVPLIRRIQSR